MRYTSKLEQFVSLLRDNKVNADQIFIDPIFNEVTSTIRYVAEKNGKICSVIDFPAELDWDEILDFIHEEKSLADRLHENALVLPVREDEVQYPFNFSRNGSFPSGLLQLSEEFTKKGDPLVKLRITPTIYEDEGGEIAYEFKTRSGVTEAVKIEFPAIEAYIKHYVEQEKKVNTDFLIGATIFDLRKGTLSKELRKPSISCTKSYSCRPGHHSALISFTSNLLKSGVQFDRIEAIPKNEGYCLTLEYYAFHESNRVGSFFSSMQPDRKGFEQYITDEIKEAKSLEIELDVRPINF